MTYWGRQPLVCSRLCNVLLGGEHEALRAGAAQDVKARRHGRMHGQPKSGPEYQGQDVPWPGLPTRGGNVALIEDFALVTHPEHTTSE